MSQANVEVVRESFARFQSEYELDEQFLTPDFVWDMSNFSGWPEQQTYEGPEGVRRFLAEWTGAWEDWQIEIEALHGAGDKVVAIMRQSGRSKASRLAVDMSFAQVWTVRDGLGSRMDMYNDPAEALKAVGLSQ